MNFDQAHTQFVKQHLSARSGERRDRLERGHRHAETLFLRQIWWLLRGHFEHLHPEYEVPDWRGRSYFADFAWLPGFIKLIIEIKGYATHVQDMDRRKFCNELNRETFLRAMGYQVISFSYDDVEQRPDLCLTLLRLLIGQYETGQVPVSRTLLAEKEVLRLAMQSSAPIRLIDVARHFDIDNKSAMRMLRSLSADGWLIPAYSGAKQRIVRYELAPHAVNYFL
ncbi:hypothetical protein B1748_12240 [Paenibacillus sp. MY03]|jgi:very-short-patch-repair endonuclease|uniref:DUF559 domain-containing protein n=1 Tax=Paenibacillus agaridevorans TaxID=171404 RepID=A0A2R5ELK1_9BACL|nr:MULTISPECIES: DUF559 domain-containing protein [Paenibacillus]OUS76446.1 hypothetical protein B1748_12240 [Paenibacillus sp. MY03]GBG07427.1 hypothetical protein PAT3040_01978 [Paenibacillus agaridevorans]